MDPAKSNKNPFKTNPDKKPAPKKSTQRRVGEAVALLVAGMLVLSMCRPDTSDERVEEISLSEVLTTLDDGDIVEATINDSSRTVTITIDDDVEFSSFESLAELDDVDELDHDTTELTAWYPALYGSELADRFAEADVEFTTDKIENPSTLLSVLLNLIPVFLIIGFLVYFMRGKMGMAGIGKSNAAVAEVPDTRFTDIAGLDEVVDELREVADYLHRPERFAVSGARLPHGFLLVGPAGTGKTLLARAVAGEAGVPFFSIAGSDFVETFVGVGASRVRDVFAKARKHGKAIIFIDEIDAVGKARSSGPTNGASDERENTLNALLVEMDGFTQTNIIVLAATNRVDVLDPALTRAGRFDRTVSVHAPDRAGRTDLLELYTAKHKLDPSVDLVSFARRTPGLTGADISFLVNEAALQAVRDSSPVITTNHLESALATSVLGRERRSRVINEADRRVTAWHESGHTIAALLQPAAEDPVQVTIVPRGDAGGVTWMSGSDSPYLTRSKALADLVVAMSGRAAEELLLDGDFTQGASGDLAHATKLANDMVTRYGMVPGSLATLNTSELFGAQAERVHIAVDELLATALDQARALVSSERALLEAIAAGLLAEETLHLSDLEALRARFEVGAAATVADKGPGQVRVRRRRSLRGIPKV